MLQIYLKYWQTEIYLSHFEENAAETTLCYENISFPFQCTHIFFIITFHIIMYEKLYTGFMKRQRSQQIVDNVHVTRVYTLTWGGQVQICEFCVWPKACWYHRICEGCF